MALTLAHFAGDAQTLTELRLFNTNIQAGQSARAMVNFVLHDGITQCGMRIHWGDGVQEDVKISEDKDVPLVISHRYDSPGTYQLKAEPKTMLPLLKCLGLGQWATLVVAPATSRSEVRR